MKRMDGRPPPGGSRRDTPGGSPPTATAPAIRRGADPPVTGSPSASPARSARRGIGSGAGRPAPGQGGGERERAPIVGSHGCCPPPGMTIRLDEAAKSQGLDRSPPDLRLHPCPPAEEGQSHGALGEPESRRGGQEHNRPQRRIVFIRRL